ncbi:MAG: hypothetical protein H6Q70_3192 [Firmicutes bacterium]|nr:hypothetical protein [Bacillota bacterium]
MVMIGVCLLCCLLTGSALAAEPTDFWQYEKNIEQVAEPLTEQVMQAINDEDYGRFQSCVSKKMKAAFPESAFKKLVSDLKGKFGSYKTKEVMSIELREEYMMVNYKGFFSQATDPLLMRTVLVQENGKTCVGGIWFNPMKLAGHTDPNPYK